MKTILQIGTCDAQDHVYDIIKQNNFENIFGIFVEPNIHSIPLIKERYNLLKNKIISNIAITTYDGIIPIYFSDYTSGNSQHACINISHVYQHGNNADNITKVDVNCLTLNTYLNKILCFDEKTIIDNLYIDTEGHDCDIILNIDFKKLNVREIYFEIAHTEGAFTGKNTEKFKKTDNYLTNNGFSFKEIINNDSAVYIKN